MTSPRERILARVRTAVATHGRIAHPGPLVAEDRTAGGAGTGDVPSPGTDAEQVNTRAPRSHASRFAEQFLANGGEVVRLGSTDAARTWLATFVRDFEGVATGMGLPPDLCPPLPVLPAASAPLGVSLAVGAAAETGTLLLDSGEGRRQQLLPPTHVVWIRDSDIDGTLGTALTRLRAGRADGLPATVGLHSAPSKSADIGRILVVGVHGPGRIVAAIIANGEDT